MDKTRQFSAFSIWLDEFPGRYYLRYEQEELNTLLPELYGYYLVQAGILDNYDLKSASTINHHIYIGHAPDSASSHLSVETNLNELPFQYESVDVFFMPHTLEFCAQPVKLLSEIYNILIPGGKVIIFGFNPYSIFGLTKLLKYSKNNLTLGKFIAPWRIKKYLNDAEFSVDFHKNMSFLPAWREGSLLQHCSFLESVGKRCLPGLGSVYMMIAQKKTVPLSPVKLKVFSKKVHVPSAFPEPSTHKGVYEG